MRDDVTWKPNGKSTLHRDGSISLFDIYSQQWQRLFEVSDKVLATLSEVERSKIQNHLKGENDER